MSAALGQAKADGQGRKLAIALVLLAAAAAVAILVWQGSSQVPAAATGIAAALAAFGLFAILGWLAGLWSFSQPEPTTPLLDIVADGIGDAIVVTDANGLPRYSNTEYLKLTSEAGMSRLVGMDVLFAGYPDFVEPLYQLTQAAQSGKSLHRDVRVQASSSVPGASASEPRWLRLSVSPVAVAGSKPHVVWRLTNITEDRTHQESAFSRLQFIITYLDHAPAGFFSTLPSGRVDYVNATLADWLGLDLASLQDGKMTLARLVGEDNAKLLTATEAKPGESRTETFTLDLRTSKNVNLPVEIIHRTDFDVSGNALTSRSMVLRKHADTQARAAGSTAELLAPLAPMGIASLDETGTVLAANAYFLGLSDKIKRQANLATAISAASDINLSDVIERLVREGGRETLAVSFDSTPPRLADLTLARIDGEEGLIAFAVDRTENKALEVQLAQSQKMQAVGQLASGIAHDFNNVLTPILGFADLLLSKMRPTDAAFGDIMNIKQNANRAANLVRQLLAFSRKQTMQPKLHLLTDAMSDLGNLLGRVLGEKIELEIIHARDSGFVKVDIHQFEQVIINLAVNARDAMPKGGKLTVRTYNLDKEQSREISHALPEGDYVACDVSDTGTGIPKDIVDKIWEPFFSTKEVGKGTGLGLSMVYGIIKQSGGFIFCESEIGKGTTFRIFLPRHWPEAVAPEQAALKAKEEAVRADFTGRGRILVVEDEDSVRAFAVRALSSRGYTVVEADSGESALDIILADKQGFELILSDVVMPEMDGPTMLAEIRKRGINTRFIFMSGYAEDAFERNLENPDDFGFLQKPFTLKQLVEKVKAAIA